MNALNSTDIDVVKDDGMKYSLIYILLAVIQGVSTFFTVWNFSTIGCTYAMIYRKKVFKKYLTYHMAFYDIPEHAPGALLTRLSIDTMQLSSIIFSLIGSTVQCIATAVTGLAFGFSYDWRLTLIIFAFVPFMCFTSYTRVSMRHGNNKESMMCNIAAGSVLSECAVNTKTIFSFNFQDKGLELFMDCLQYIIDNILRDSLINGIFLGIGQLAVFASSSTMFYASKCFLLDGSLSSNDMSLVLNILMTSSSGISQSVGQL